MSCVMNTDLKHGALSANWKMYKDSTLPYFDITMHLK